MKTYTAFEAEFLVACYLVSERSGKDIVEVKDVLAQFPLGPKPNWVMRAIDSFLGLGLAKDMRTLGSELDQDVWLTASGVKEAERLLNEGVVDIVAPEDGQEPEVDGAALEESAPRVDSASWTGLASIKITEENKELVRGALGKAATIVAETELSNEQRVQAVVLLRAAEELLEAPEPPSEIIWQLIERAGAVCGIAGLFISLFLAAVA